MFDTVNKMRKILQDLKIRILQGMARGVVTVTSIKGVITFFDCIVEYIHKKYLPGLVGH